MFGKDNLVCDVYQQFCEFEGKSKNTLCETEENTM